MNIQTSIGLVNLVVDETAKRKVPYLHFQSIIIPAKGKKAASCYSVSANEIEKLFGPVKSLDDSSVMTLLSFSLPLVKEAVKDGKQAKELFAAISNMVDEYQKEAGTSTVLRKVDDSILLALANIFLISAGTSGKIPETLDLSAFMQKARKQAEDKANTLGRDEMGQFRLKKPKTAEPAKDEVQKEHESILELEDAEA